MVTTNSTTDKRNERVLRELKDAGVGTARLVFSGGNDEGSVDCIEYFDIDGEQVAVSLYDNRAYQHTVYNATTKKWDEHWTVTTYKGIESNSRPATPDEISHANDIDFLEAPIYDKFGSFSGDFYVEGVLVWDVVAGTYKLSGKESVQSYESFEYENE